MKKADHKNNSGTHFSSLPFFSKAAETNSFGTGVNRKSFFSVSSTVRRKANADASGQMDEQLKVQPKCAACENEEKVRTPADGGPVQKKQALNNEEKEDAPVKLQMKTAGTEKDKTDRRLAEDEGENVQRKLVLKKNREKEDRVQKKCNDCESKGQKNESGDIADQRIQKKPAGAPLTGRSLLAIQKQSNSSNTTTAASSPTPVSAPATVATGAGSAPAAMPAEARFIIEDNVAPDSNRLRKSDFLIRLNRQICATVDEVLAGTPFSSQTCPYITRAFGRLNERTPFEIESTLYRYEPLLRNAQTLQQFFDTINNRVRQVVAAWLQNGDLSGVPPEIAAAIPERFRGFMGLAGRVSGLISNVSSGLGRAASAATSFISGLFFKADEGNVLPASRPAEVMNELGEGSSLEGGTRNRMESAFGTSFSDVQLHTDYKAASLASEMNARAFTVGNHVAFASGEYKPGTVTGDALLAHELAHVQQQKGNTAATMFNTGEQDNEPLEREADDTAVTVVSSLWGEKNEELAEVSPGKLPSLKTGLKLQRCGGGPTQPQWNGNLSELRINIYTTTTLSEAATDPGEAITRDFPSFAARLNYYEHPYPRVTSYRLLDSNNREVMPPRVPSSRGVSRIPMPPIGNYRLVAHTLTGLANMPHATVERQVRIIDSYKNISAAQAPGELSKQAGQTLEGNVIGFETFAAVLRQNAVTAAGVSADLVNSWNTANQQAIQIEASINTSINPTLSTSTKTALAAFYRLFRTTIAGRDVYHEEESETVCADNVGACGVVTTPAYTSNPFQTEAQSNEIINRLNSGGHTASEWRTYLNTFYDVTNLLNRYIAERLEAAGLREAAQQLRTSGSYANHLRKLYRDHPDAKPVQAVFYPKLQPNLRNDAPPGSTEPHYTLTALPQKMYTWRTPDGVWHLLDMTRPDRAPYETEESGGTLTQPPRTLMTELDSEERFPQGMLYWRFDNGPQDSCEMTHPWTWSEVLNLISAVLAVAGIVALVVASGGTAAPALLPTICFVASGLIGAAGAAAHIHESSELGTLTPQSVTVDVINIAANLLSAGAAGTGHIVKAAQAAETAWTGSRAVMALAAQTSYRTLQAGAVFADAVNLLAFADQAMSQYQQIQAMPDGDAKRFAMQRLVAMSLVTGTMTLISIRGGMHDIGAGRTLYLDFTTINGVRTAVAHRVMPQADILAHTRLATARTEAEAVLQRTDLDSATLDGFRGELSVALNTPGLSEAEIRSFVQRMRSATQAEARTILSEFRNNRVNVSVGGVSRGSGYDLTYFHTNPADFHASVQRAFADEGAVAHNGTLRPVGGNEPSAYTLRLDTASGTRVEADVNIVYQDFATGSAVGAGTAVPGAAQSPARNVVVWDASRNRWTVRVEVDKRLAPADIRRAVGHELDEAGDVIHRLHGNQGPDIQQRINQLQQPGLLTNGNMTSHDFATLREINLLLAQRATNPRAGESLSMLLRDMGLTTDRGQFQTRLERLLRAGVISSDNAVLLEAWATYDMALMRRTRLRSMTREEFIREYENGWRFDEGGTDRWYKLDVERGAARQFFTAQEMADHNLAFERLAGTGSTSSFKPYYDMLLVNGLAKEGDVRKRLTQLMNGPRGGDLDFVRHQLKDTYRDRVLAHMTDRARLSEVYPGKTFEEASHSELVRMTNGLNSSDKGSLAEDWYHSVFSPQAAQHVRITGASGTTRFPDLLHPDGTLQDLKFIEGRLSDREIAQFDDYRQMIGRDATRVAEDGSTSTIRVQRVRYSFMNPVGVEANAAWMHRTIRTSSGDIAFEIFNRSGQRRVITSAGVFEGNTLVADVGFLIDATALSAWLNR